MDDLKTSTRTEKQMLKVKFSGNDGQDGVMVQWSETHFITKKDASDTVVAEDKKTGLHTYEADYRPHKDFVECMKMLRKHVISICEFGNFKNFDMYRINGISLSGMQSDDDAGVVISAGKELESGKVFNFVTPFTHLGDKSNYADAKQLDEFLVAICKAAFDYKDGKHAENPQMTIQYESGSENLKVQE